LSIHVISRVLQHSRQSGSTRMVLTVIAEHADHDGWCFPDMGRIAARAGLKERQTRTHVRALDAAGELYCYQQRGRHRPNQYLVTVGLDEATIARTLAQRFPRAFDTTTAAVMAHTLVVRQYGEGPTAALQCWQSSAAVHSGKTGNEPTETGNIGSENRQTDCRRTVIENCQDKASEREVAAAPRPPTAQKQEEFGSESEAETLQSSKSRQGMPEDFALLNHKAVQMYCQVTGVRPTLMQRRMIAETVNENDCTNWGKVLQDWMLHGWRPTNVFGMLERYRDGDSLQWHGRNRRSVEEYRARIETRKDEPPCVVNNDIDFSKWGWGRS
jgi:hypothetical protein